MKFWLPPVVLILIVNGLALLSAGRNRSEVRSEVELSDRELSVHGESRDRSTITLHLMHSQVPLAARGKQGHLSRRGFAALEFNGPSLQEVPQQTGREVSRLVVVDYADQAAELEAKYPDRNRYLIIPAKTTPSSEGQLQYVWLDVSGIEVPTELRHIFDNSTPTRRRFLAKIRFGANYEPWLESARRVD